jgi:hypothetical protein
VHGNNLSIVLAVFLFGFITRYLRNNLIHNNLI